MSALFPNFRRFLPIVAGAALLAVAFILAASDVRAADVGCTKICAQIIQAIGDDIKEQIPLDCIQQTGACTGSGYFQTANGRVPVNIEGGLAGDTLTLKVSSGQTSFVPSDKDALVMPLQPDNPYQAMQFVVGQRAPDAPFAMAGTSLTLTVVAERQM
jgi:hypothetical protein